MIVHYFDSRAWVERYYEERGSNPVRGIFRSGLHRCCSQLGWVEVAAALTRKARGGGLSRVDLHSKLAELDRDWAACGIAVTDPEAL